LRTSGDDKSHSKSKSRQFSHFFDVISPFIIEIENPNLRNLIFKNLRLLRAPNEKFLGQTLKVEGQLDVVESIRNTFEVYQHKRIAVKRFESLERTNLLDNFASSEKLNVLCIKIVFLTLVMMNFFFLTLMVLK